MDERFLYNDRKLKDYRKRLRNNQTFAEKRLWYLVNNNQVNGLRFFRQYSVGPYILDFFCPKARLAIELDGGQHLLEGSIVYDEERKRYLNSLGIEVLRFMNSEVFKSENSVLQTIEKTVSDRNPLNPPYPKGDRRRGIL